MDEIFGKIPELIKLNLRLSFLEWLPDEKGAQVQKCKQKLNFI